MEKCNWNQMVYVADDPNKDFYRLNPLGVKQSEFKPAVSMVKKLKMVMKQFLT